MPSASNAQIIRVFILFFNKKKKEAKNAALKRREAGTAQNAFVALRHALACEVGCPMNVGCETDLRAVRDGFIRWSFGMAFCQGLFDVLRNGKGIACWQHSASHEAN